MRIGAVIVLLALNSVSKIETKDLYCDVLELNHYTSGKFSTNHRVIFWEYCEDNKFHARYKVSVFRVWRLPYRSPLIIVHHFGLTRIHYVTLLETHTEYDPYAQDVWDYPEIVRERFLYVYEEEGLKHWEN